MKKEFFYQIVLVLAISVSFFNISAQNPLVNLNFVSDVFILQDIDNNTYLFHYKKEGKDSTFIENFSTNLNFNPTLDLKENETLESILNIDKIESSTIFSVYKNTLKNDIIWSIGKADSSILALTPKRISDLKNGIYFNNTNSSSTYVISTYYQNIDTTYGGDLNVKFGNAHSYPVLPYDQNESELAELIICDGIISSKNRLVIETYLSLKYGISLDQQSYLNSDSYPIWEYKRNKKYSNNIAGIGRDNESGLYQKQATNSEENNLLVIGQGIDESNQENNSIIDNNSFLLWGNDGKDTKWIENEQGQADRLDKTWLVNSTGSQLFETVIDLKISAIENEIGSETYWMVIDSSGYDNFDYNNTIFIQGINNNQKIRFNYNWNTTISNKEHLRFLRGGVIIPKIWITPPVCETNESGILHAGVEGGTAPYSFSLTLEDEIITSWKTNNTQLINWTGLEYGTYVLTIEDNNGNFLSEELYVEASDAPAIQIQDEYTLEAKKALILDAYIENQNVSYQWTFNNEIISTSHNLFVNQKGIYNLELDENGCKANKNINISSNIENPYMDISLQPNPSLDGKFTVGILLHDNEDIHVVISNLNGNIIDNYSLTGSQFYSISGFIDISGLYLIKISSTTYSETIKLIITK